MGEQSRVGRRDIAAGGSVVLSLLVAYVAVPEPIVHYGAWLVIFTIWMVWFV